MISYSEYMRLLSENLDRDLDQNGSEREAEIIPVVFDRHNYRPDDEGNCWECGEAQPAHLRGFRYLRSKITARESSTLVGRLD